VPGGDADVLKWKIARGGAAAAPGLQGLVAGGAALRLCLYDASGAAQPVLAGAVAAGATCGSKPCWRRLGASGARYKSKTATPDGIALVKLEVAAGGELRLLLKGKGAALPDPSLPLATPVTVQLAIGEGAAGACWQAIFAGASRSTDVVFKAAAP
jgi:hypothetical protein